MEYVLLCVMIAGGSMLMVITFSRAVMRQIALVSYTMTYPGDDLKELQERFRDDTENDATVANIYSESFQGNFFRTDK